jgi:ribosome-associated toxin RatA of RatAB toxin-antitoxin module
MADAHVIETFNCTPKEFFDIASDYEKYPEFLSEVKACKVLKTEGDTQLVEYKVSVVKTMSYQLKTKQISPSLVSWEFTTGDAFKTMSGSWKIEEAPGGKCKCAYDVEATFKMFVTGPVAKTLLTVNLPAMMSAYHKRIKALYGK